MKNNLDVATAFVMGVKAHNRSMKTDGRVLHSYNTPIAVHGDGGIWVTDDTHYSVTTAKHFSDLFSAMQGFNPTKEIATLSWLVDHHPENWFPTYIGWASINGEWRLYKTGAPEYTIPRRLNPGSRAPRVKIMDQETARRVGLSRFPNFGPYGNVIGMRKLYYGKNALLVRCGAFVYNVTSAPEIYEMAK